MLQLQFYQNTEKYLQFKTNANFFRVGRGSECELSLPDESISRVHLIFRFQDEAWKVEDVSSNGVRVDREFLGSHFRLEKSKIYEFGKCFSFEWPASPARTEEKTIVLSRRPTQILLTQESSEDCLMLGEARITGLNEKGEKITRRIGAEGLSIGRHASNDLRIDSEMVSQFHARIEIRNNQFHLIDLGSTNGSFVDGQNTIRAILSPFAKLQFGNTHWQFGIERHEVVIQDKKSDSFFGMISKNKKMKRVFAMAEAVAQTDAPVFIQGETGTGKELLARALHDLSPRSSQAFLTLNCAAMPKELIESELFGHTKGAFTGAIANRVGAFEDADGGTIFLDEIAELDIHLQAKLLRVLETGEVRRLGSNESIITSVRVISATHKDLLKMVKEGRFREDLYFRLHVVPLQLPALRERKEDIKILVPHLFEQLRATANVNAEALEILERQDYPGNIRQLKNILQRALVEFRMRKPFHSKTEAIEIEAQDLKFISKSSKKDESVSAASLKEREQLEDLLRTHDFNQSKAARELKIPISTLHDRIRRLSIEIPRKKKTS